MNTAKREMNVMRTIRSSAFVKETALHLDNPYVC